MLGDWAFGAGYSLTSLARKASAQVDKALSGSRLSSYRDADDIAHFWTVATNVRDAYLKAAYWLAVAAQCASSNSLANYAKAYYANGVGLSVTGEPANVYKQAASIVASTLPNDVNGRAIRAALAESDQSKIDTAKKAEFESSVVGIATGTVKTSASDVARATDIARGVVTGKKPRGMSNFEWWMKKWGWRVGIGAVGVGTLLWLGRPYIKALRRSPAPSSPSSPGVSDVR